MRVPLRRQHLDPGHFVSGSSVIAGDLRFDNNNRMNLVRDTKIRSLSEAWDPLSPVRFSEGDTSRAQCGLYRILHYLSYTLRDRVPMSRKRAPEVALVKKGRIGNILGRGVLKGPLPFLGIELVQSMDHPVDIIRSALRDVTDGRTDQYFDPSNALL